MSFYYGSNSPSPPEDKPGGWKDTFLIVWAVFRVLAVPLGLLLAAVSYIVLLFWLFTLHPLAGLAGILLVIGLLVGRGVWEAKHPPELK